LNVNKILIIIKELELKIDLEDKKPICDYFKLQITSPYKVNYSISTRIYSLRLKSIINYETFIKIVKINEKEDYKKLNLLNDKELCEVIKKYINNCNYDQLKNTFGFDSRNDVNEKEIISELIAESIFCLAEIIRLTKTLGDTLIFNHSFMGSIYEKLSFWMRVYDAYRTIIISKKNNTENFIYKSLERYFGNEWKEQISDFYSNQQALSHHYKALETHNEGKAYHAMIDNMCFLKDDYNDRSDHFNLAEERYNIHIINDNVDILKEELGKKTIEVKIDILKEIKKDSRLYDLNNYFT
jgi:hypothetical protein